MTLLVEIGTCELVTEFPGPVFAGDMITVREMDTDDNVVCCRVLCGDDDRMLVEVVQGQLIVVSSPLEGP